MAVVGQEVKYSRWSVGGLKYCTWYTLLPNKTSAVGAAMFFRRVPLFLQCALVPCASKCFFNLVFSSSEEIISKLGTHLHVA